MIRKAISYHQEMNPAVTTHSKIFRIDSGRIINEPWEDDFGTLYVEATIASPGILKYVRSDGSEIRELRTPDTNQQLAFDLSNQALIVTNAHPPEMVTSANSQRYFQGFTQMDKTRYDEGYVRSLLAISSDPLKEDIKSKRKTDVSLGYLCHPRNDSGVWMGEHYDRIQDNLKPNHIAVCYKGRAKGAKLHYFDDIDQAFDEIASRYDGIDDFAVQYIEPETQRYFDMATSYSNNGVAVSDPNTQLLLALERINHRMDMVENKINGVDQTASLSQYRDSDYDRLSGSYDQLREDHDNIVNQYQALQLDAADLERQIEEKEQEVNELRSRLDTAEEILGQYKWYWASANEECPEPGYEQNEEEVLDALEEELEDYLENSAEEEEFEEEDEKDEVFDAIDPNEMAKFLLRAVKQHPSLEDRLDELDTPGDVFRAILEDEDPTEDYSDRSDEECQILYEGMMKAKRKIDSDRSHYDEEESSYTRNTDLMRATALLDQSRQYRQDKQGKMEVEYEEELPDDLELKRAKMQDEGYKRTPKNRRKKSNEG